MEVNACDRCANCHREFADHNYVPDTIDTYLCPVPVTETGYGYFKGGDPRDFSPDVELCSESELDAWKKACDMWNEAERRGATPTPEDNPSGWIHDPVTGRAIAHVLRSPYGIGIYTIEFESTWEPIDAMDEQQHDLDDYLFD